MSGQGLDANQPDWDWRLSFELAVYTLVVTVVVSSLVGVVLVSVADQLGLQIIGSPLATSIFGVSEAILLVPLLLTMRKSKISHCELGIHTDSLKQAILDVIFGIMIGLLLILVSMISIAVNEALLGPQPDAEYVRTSFTASSPVELILLLFAVILVVAPSEEIIVRGFIQQGFVRSFGKMKGIVLASLYFSFLHLNLWSLFPLTLLGIVLGASFLMRRNRILTPTTSHAFYMAWLVLSASI